MSFQNEYTLLKYEKNINNVINYISENVHKDLSLDELSEAACFSKFHFHRIFKAFVGETASDFRRRLQLEKAAYQLVYTAPRPITEIALDCGFSSSQNFAKAFRIRFNATPSEYRKRSNFRTESNIGNMFRKNGNAENRRIHYTDFVNSDSGWLIKLDCGAHDEIRVNIKTLPDIHAMYSRRIGGYSYGHLAPLFDDILQKGVKYDLLTKECMVFGIIWDYSEITADDRCRYDACISLPESFCDRMELNTQVLRGGKYAVYRCTAKNNDFHEAWHRLLHDWLPASGFDLDDKPCFEIFPEVLRDSNGGDTLFEICLPVR